MKDNAAIKKAAKSHLANNWSKAMATMCIILLSSLAAFIAEELINNLIEAYGVIRKFDIARYDLNTEQDVFIAYIKEYFSSRDFFIVLAVILFIILIRFLIISPLHQGQTAWYYCVADGKNDQLDKLFYYYSTNDMYTSALSFRFSLFMKKLGYAIISFIACAVALGMTVFSYSTFRSTNLEADREKTTLYLIIAVALFVLGIILFIMLVLRLFLARYLFAKYTVEVKHVNIDRCFEESRKLMTKNRGRVISLFFSVLPLCISCVLIIPLIYVYPYFFCCCAELADEIISSGSNK